MAGIAAFIAAAGGSLGGPRASALEDARVPYLRVEEEDGASVDGRARLGAREVEVETAQGKRRIPYGRVKSLEEIDPGAPPPEAQRPADRVELEARARALEAEPGSEPRKTARAWASLGSWALRRGLAPEARRAFDRAVELDPDEADARRARGEARDEDGSWKDARALFEARRAKSPGTPASLYELGRWARANGLDEEAIAVVSPLVKKDAFDKALLAYLRPLTDRRPQRTPSLELPLRGRWRVSTDPTHHHEKKAYAVYAVDFYREVEGKTHRGDGKALEDWYAFGEPIHAAADGEVVEVREGFPDNPINQCEGKAEKHNGLTILHAGGEATWYIHTRKGSILLKKGDHVRRGDVIARVGNSGGSAAPHLHFTLVDAYHGVSIPWRVEGYWLLVEGGARVPVRRGRPVEGQVVEGQVLEGRAVEGPGVEGGSRQPGAPSGKGE